MFEFNLCWVLVMELYWEHFHLIHSFTLILGPKGQILLKHMKALNFLQFGKFGLNFIR